MRLVDVAEVKMGYPFRSRLEPVSTGDLAVIQMKDIDDSNRLNPATAVKISMPQLRDRSHLLRKGDLLFRSRGNRYSAALVSTDVGRSVLAAPLLLIRPYGVTSDYLCWLLNTSPYQARLAALSEGTSLRMISAEALRNLELPIPSRDCQQRIAEAAALANREQELLAEIAAQRRRLTTHLLIQHAREKMR